MQVTITGGGGSLARLRPDLVALAAALEGHQAMISPAKAERAFGFRAEHRWTELPAETAGGTP
ncbi:MAG TPA: hypothetical protein VG370_12700 [Chloroflexota bacterium]|nr:hypothetical protein [Chloroflexota bacterium]